MKIAIEQIRIDEATRIRQDVGDLTTLEQSITQVGLINPILVDENNTLVAGFRRLSACKNLGWQEIEVHVAELEGDELKMLEAEVAENLFRKDFTAEEILATETRRQQILEARRPKGVWERFWLWLKNMFGANPESESAEPVTTADNKTSPADKPETIPAEQNEDPPVDPPETEEKVEPEKEATVETVQTVSKEPVAAEIVETVSKEPVAAEIVERDGRRHIKWR